MSNTWLIVWYVLNGKPLSDGTVGTLYIIDNKVLKRLRFVPLSTDEAVPPVNKKKRFALYIWAKRPKDLKARKDWE